LSAPLIGEDWRARLSALEFGWDGYTGASITRAAMAMVEEIAVVPTSDGGLQLEFHRDGWDFEICVGPDGKVESVVVEVIRS
jgi:hypothetical protein